MYQLSKNMTELGTLIEEVRVLLGWPTNRKLVKLVDKYPSEELWRYALGKLSEADHPNEKYLLACLETASKIDVSAARRGKKDPAMWPIWFCYKCGYAVEYCRITANWDICPNCLRKGVESKLRYIDRSVPGWSRGS